MISMNKYNRLMEHINVTPDMLVRAHAALDAGKQPKSTRNTVPLRRYGALAACLAVVICGASLLNRQLQDDPVQALPPSATGEIVEYDTTAELAENLPFTLRLPMELPGGYACTGAADSFGTAGTASATIWARARAHSTAFIRPAKSARLPRRTLRSTRTRPDISSSGQTAITALLSSRPKSSATTSCAR